MLRAITRTVLFDHTAASSSMNRVPDAITTRLRESMRKVMADPEFARLMRARFFGIEYVDGPAFDTWLEAADKRFGDAARAAGMAR